MPWVIAAWSCTVLPGYFFLWVALINRVHSLRLHSSTLKRFRHVSYALAPLIPILLLLCGGLPFRWGSQQLTLNLTPLWLVWTGLCLSGLAWAFWCRIRRLLIKMSPRQLKTISKTYDLAAELGRMPLPAGKRSFLATLPGNVQFQLEVSHKELALPRLPAAWDGMAILHLSDFHFHDGLEKELFVRALKHVAREPVDLVCFTGDLLDQMKLTDWIPETLGQLKAPLGEYFILGNHDWYLEPERIRTSLTELGWKDVSSRIEVVSFRGSRLAIGGDETPWMGTHPPFDGTADFQLLLGHTPDNIRWAREHEIDLMLSGHNHGGQVKLPVIGPVFSPSFTGVKYSDGTFREGGTMLHVVRGLSGQHPFRWRCLPEITRLVLRTG